MKPIGFALAMLALGCYSAPEHVDVAALRFENGPLMRPGENCLRCHKAGGQAAQRPWSAAGTVFMSSTSDEGAPGVTVRVVDADKREVTLTTNAAGNFYTAEPLRAPLRLRLEHLGRSKEMPEEAPAGSCNACHSSPDPAGNAKGRIFLPLADSRADD